MPEILRDKGADGFLNHFLMPALHGAVPVKQVDGIAEAVRQDLDLHMPDVFQAFFQENLIGSESGAGFVHTGGESVLHLFWCTHRADSFSASAAYGFEQDGISDPFRLLQAGVSVSQAAFAGRNDRQTGLDGGLLGQDLIPQHMKRVGGGADKVHPDVGAYL